MGLDGRPEFVAAALAGQGGGAGAGGVVVGGVIHGRHVTLAFVPVVTMVVGLGARPAPLESAEYALGDVGQVIADLQKGSEESPNSKGQCAG